MAAVSLRSFGKTQEIHFQIHRKYTFKYTGNMLSNTREIHFQIHRKYTFKYTGNIQRKYTENTHLNTKEIYRGNTQK